ncbi:AGE family epimerase/isomerase [Planktotalea sp.]|uniref:AGE family epimerase/isomerase n=1 Tax=Planktotalea sp. TaxID=2029877 RepID=UPI003296EDA4
MTEANPNSASPLCVNQPAESANAEKWVVWYWDEFLPAWAARARDPEGPGFYDLLDKDGNPDRQRKTVLAQARLLFTFAHMALLSGNPAHHAAAKAARDALGFFRKSSSLYRRAVSQNGQANDMDSDSFATSYDQSFIILGLSTWGKLNPEEDTQAELETLWAAIEEHLVDASTGLLLEHDNLTDPACATAPPRAQNPHMHLFEAALQAFEMTGDNIWLARAKRMRAKGLEFFFDANSGTITEFIAPDLAVLPAREGLRREIGHQCEWAWLLMREVELGGDPDMAVIAERLLSFADNYGFGRTAILKGAAFDAVSADTKWREDRFLLWPQTEAIKAHAIRSTDPAYAAKARALVQLMFRRYFAGRHAFVNQLDETGAVLWPDALSRLHYHVVLALTEGARAGLWPNPK